MTKIFEITDAGFVNQGAAMMLIAATQQIREVDPNAIIAITPDSTTPYQAHAALGLWHRAELKKLGLDWGKSLNQVPQKLRWRYGFITEGEVDIILNAAGLAYSDQWGAGPTQTLANKIKNWSAQGKKIILLPQALGPFTSPEIQTAIGQVAEHATFIFARDKISYQHLVDVVGARQNIQVAPDFTNLLKGSVPDDYKIPSKGIALVPNCRMLDKTTEDEKQGYIPFMQNCANQLLDAGMTPFFLIHEGPEDYRLAETINAGLDKPIAIIQYDDPLVTKGILGTCHGVIASRFHALVSALSQNVPCLGTGWSHKYQELFEDYGCPEGLLPISIKNNDLAEKLRLLYDDTTRTPLVKTIEQKSKILKQKSRLMWQDVFSELEK